jgi:hypothetical protein
VTLIPAGPQAFATVFPRFPTGRGSSREKSENGIINAQPNLFL